MYKNTSKILFVRYESLWGKIQTCFSTQSNPSNELKNPPVELLIKVQIPRLPDMNSLYSSGIENPPVEFIFW